MDSSPFSKLAPELRNQIYALVLYEPEGIRLIQNLGVDPETYELNDDGRITARHKLCTRRLLALTTTCKEIRAECLKMFYATNTFIIRPAILSKSVGHWSKASSDEYQSALLSLQVWMRQIQPQARHAMQRLVLELPGGDVRDLGKRATYWWNNARKLEKQSLHKVLSPSSIYISFSMMLYDCGITKHTSTTKGSKTCHLDVLRACSVITYKLSTHDKTLAKAKAEEVVEAKRAQIEADAKKYSCCIGVLLSDLSNALKASEAAVLKALGK